MYLKSLSNPEIAGELSRLTHRMGELSMWIEESDRKICGLLLDPYSAPEQVEGKSKFPLYSRISAELDLMQSAQIEKYIVLSDLKKIELELDRRII